MTSAPASRSSFAMSAVSPAPPAAFSPLTITSSIRRSLAMAGTSAATACRPGLPTTSPTKRILTRAIGSAGQSVDLVHQRVVRGGLRVHVVREGVVLIDQTLIGVVDGRREDA